MIKKVLKWTGIVLLILIVGSLLFGLFGLKQARELQIDHVDLSLIPDGTYTGTYESFRWSNTVTVTVRDHRIMVIDPVSPLAGREELSDSLMQHILDSNTNNVDAVSGATASSNAFLKAVEIALKNAGT